MITSIIAFLFIVSLGWSVGHILYASLFAGNIFSQIAAIYLLILGSLWAAYKFGQWRAEKVKRDK